MAFNGMKRWAVGAVAATALMAGSGLGFMGQAFAADKVLKFVSWQKDERGVGDWWASIIKEFEAKHPGVKIEWTKVERGAFADTMTTLFAGGTPPDIVHLASFEFQKFADNGWLADLDPFIKKSKLDLNNWAGQEKCKWDGETVCIMMLYYGGIMAYNEDMLKKAGVSVPKNWDEFIEVVRKTTKDTNGDGIMDQFGTGHETKGGGGQYLAEMISYLLDAKAAFTDAKGNVTIDTPQMVEGLRRWKTVVKDNLTPRDLSAGEIRQLFADGRIAIRIDGPWLYPIIEKAKPEVRPNLKLAAPPFNPPLGGTSNVLGIASEVSEENQQLAWDFIAIATSDQFQSTFATLASSTPPSPRADVTEAKKATPHFDLLIETQKAAAKAGVDRIPVGLEIQFNEFAKMIKEESQRMIIEDLDPAQVAKTMQAKAEAMK